MEDFYWKECLEHIRRNVDEWTYETWFSTISLGRYDGKNCTLELVVPSPFVYKYIEHYYRVLMYKTICKVFGADIQLLYSVSPDVTVRRGGDVFSPIPQRTHINVSDAAKRMKEGLRQILGEGYDWLPAYDEVAEWLTDNHGKGLLCVGASGLGKTLITHRILPALLGCNVRTVTAQEMNSSIDDLVKERCIIIDDLGKEPVETWINYRRRTPFFDLCDAAEKQGIMLIITSNLSTTPVTDPRYQDSIKRRYGNEVLSRLRTLTSLVQFEGQDMRR